MTQTLGNELSKKNIFTWAETFQECQQTIPKPTIKNPLGPQGKDRSFNESSHTSVSRSLKERERERERAHMVLIWGQLKSDVLLLHCHPYHLFWLSTSPPPTLSLCAPTTTAGRARCRASRCNLCGRAPRASRPSGRVKKPTWGAAVLSHSKSQPITLGLLSDVNQLCGNV